METTASHKGHVLQPGGTGEPALLLLALLPWTEALRFLCGSWTGNVISFKYLVPAFFSLGGLSTANVVSDKICQALHPDMF